MHEGRALARADVRRRLAHRAEAREEVGAVDRIDVHARKAAHEAGDVAARRLHFDRHGDRVAVVFDEEQDGQLLRAGRAHRFPEFAFARRAVAERDVHELVGLESRLAVGDAGNAAEDDARFRGADRLQQLRARRTRLRHDVEGFVAPVRRHLAAGGCRIVFRAHSGQQHLERRDAELQAQCAIAVVGIEPVVRRPERQRGGDEHRLMAGAADLEKDLALILELNLLVVDLARQKHRAVDGEEGGPVEPEEIDTARLTRAARITRDARLTRGARLIRGMSRRNFGVAVEDGRFHSSEL